VLKFPGALELIDVDSIENNNIKESLKRRIAALI